MHIFDAVIFMHILDAVILMHILDAVVFMHILVAVIFMHILNAFDIYQILFVNLTDRSTLVYIYTYTYLHIVDTRYTALKNSARDAKIHSISSIIIL